MVSMWQWCQKDYWPCMDLLICLICLFTKYLLPVTFVLGSVLGAEVSGVQKTDTVPILLCFPSSIYFLTMDNGNKK